MSDTALRLADEYRASMNIEILHDWAFDATAELRRLHDLVEDGRFLLRRQRDEIVQLGQALAREIERNNELEAELAEQARVNGMGSEREARLKAVNAELVEALREAVKAEREECAKVCEELVLKSADGQLGTYIAGWSDGTDDCAAAIRSRT